jgi:uncharacterized repeat protein (TIGR03803 family)
MTKNCLTPFLTLSLLALAVLAAATPAPAQTLSTLHSFDATATDGSSPIGGLIFDSSGNLYSTTSDGGTYGFGVVFKLSPRAGGGWSEEILHAFNNSTSDGGLPYGNLAFDASGNLYGTTVDGGAYSSGTVFELSPKAGGAWAERTIHSFNGQTLDG